MPYTCRSSRSRCASIRPPTSSDASRSAEVDLGPYKLPAKTTLFINIYGMHRNAKYFPDPERFDPDASHPSGEAARPIVVHSVQRRSTRLHRQPVRAHRGPHLLAALRKRVTFEPTSSAVVEGEPLITLRREVAFRLRVRRRDCAEIVADVSVGLVAAPRASFGVNLVGALASNYSGPRRPASAATCATRTSGSTGLATGAEILPRRRDAYLRRANTR